MYESPDLSAWPDLLAKFNVLAYRYKQLLEEVERLTLQNEIAHPFALPPMDEDFIPRILLRTKLLPDIETDDLKIQEGEGAELEAMVAAVDPLDEEQALEVEKTLQTRKVLHDDIVRNIQQALNRFDKSELFVRVYDAAEMDVQDGSAQKENQAIMLRLLQGISKDGL